MSMMMTNLFGMNLFSNKTEKVISTINKYYMGELGEFPYNLEDLQEAKIWYLNKHKNDIDETLVQRFNMIEQILTRRINN